MISDANSFAGSAIIANLNVAQSYYNRIPIEIDVVSDDQPPFTVNQDPLFKIHACPDFDAATSDRPENATSFDSTSSRESDSSRQKISPLTQPKKQFYYI
jgi:hypothetical protein